MPPVTRILPCLAVMLLAMLAGDAQAAMLDAARRGDVRALRTMIASRTPLDPRDEAKRTPLLVTIERGHLEAAAFLIEAGADINAQAENLDTPWLLAGARGHTGLIRKMIPRRPNLALRNRFGGSALIPACERGHVEAVAALLTSGIDVNLVNNLGWTCLLEIVILGDGGPRHVAITRLVLAAGADPNLADRDGVTPLTHARRKGQQEVARLIETAGGR
jgi:ankyrin repeat protein